MEFLKFIFMRKIWRKYFVLNIIKTKYLRQIFLIKMNFKNSIIQVNVIIF